MKKISLVTAVSIICIASYAQIKWPSINSQTTPWTRWWWMGSAVDEKGLSAQLNQIARVGFGGVEIVPIYGAIGFEDQYIKYLSPRWMKMLDYTTRQAALLKLGVDMAVGTGWPIGGPQVTIADAATKLTVQNYSVEAGSVLKEKIVLKGLKEPNIPGIFLAAVIAYNKNGTALEITGNVGPDGTLNWTADSSGEWQLLAAFNTKTHQVVKRAAPGGEGFTLDHFSPTSLNNYFKTFDNSFGSSSHGVHSFFNDSYEVYDANWSPDFFTAFKQRRGYDLKPFLKDLLSNENNETVGRIKSDYRQTMSDLMLENFTQKFTKWAHSKNATNTNQTHGSPGNLLDLYVAVDQPECETFGSSPFAIKGLRRDSNDVRNVDPDPVMLKFASSAAHAANKLLTSCETFTWLGEHFKTSWSQCKPEAEQVFLSGINHVFYHGTTYSPADVPFPGWLFYASVNFVVHNSLWPHLEGLNKYITRCQSVLQAGQPDNEIKAYWPVFDLWNSTKGLDMPFKIHDIDVWLQPTPFYKNVVDLQHKGYSIDFVSDRMLSKAAQKKSPGKSVYLVSQCQLMPVSTFKNLIKLAENGNMVVLQALPKDVPGLYKLDDEKVQLKIAIASLAFKKLNDDISLCIRGQGKIILSNNVQQGLAYVNLERETLTDLGLKFIRRQVANGKYYYIVNHTPNTIDTTITIQTPGESVAILDPQTGKTGLAKSRLNKDKSTDVKIMLHSGESLILKTFRSKQAGTAWEYLRATNEVIDLNKNWKLHFIKGGPQIPGDKEIPTLRNWTELTDTACLSFSGMAAYSTTFIIKNKIASGYLLNLGKVNESARIIINGKNAGIIWSLPFSMDISRFVKRGQNTISIEVANLMANRIRYMDQHKMVWRNYHEINFVNIDYKNFDASGWKVQPSGLEGPVTITVLK